MWSAVNTQVRSINLVVQSKGSNGTIVNREQPPLRVVEPQQRPVNDLPDELSVQLDPRLTFENFVVGKPNEFAVAAAERIATSPKPPFNPLFLYGGVGLGKTHLMHAIGHRFLQIDPGKKIVFMTAEKFMYQFVRALRIKETIAFKEMFRSVDLLMVDDVQFIFGKDSTQEEFFHTFNTLVDRGKQIVISADRSDHPTCPAWKNVFGPASAGASSPTSIRPPTSFAWAFCKQRPSSCGATCRTGCWNSWRPALRRTSVSWKVP